MTEENKGESKRGAPPTKKQRVDETPVPSQQEFQLLEQLPTDAVAHALSFLHIFDSIAHFKEIRSHAIAKAVRETPKHVSALVFDNRWQRRLTRDYVKAKYAGAIRARYSSTRVKSLTITQRCPAAMNVDFLRDMAETFPGLESVDVSGLTLSLTAVKAMVPLAALPHLVRLRGQFSALSGPSVGDIMAAITSEHLRELMVSAQAEQILRVRGNILAHLTSLFFATTLTYLLPVMGETPRLETLEIFYDMREEDDRLAFFTTVAKCAPRLKYLKVTFGIQYKPAPELWVPLFALRALRTIFLAPFLDEERTPDAVDDEWGQKAIEAWPDLEKLDFPVPMSDEFFAKNVEAWPKLRNVYLSGTVRSARLFERWILKHPLCIINVLLGWTINAHIGGEALSRLLQNGVVLDAMPSLRPLAPALPYWIQSKTMHLFSEGRSDVGQSTMDLFAMFDESKGLTFAFEHINILLGDKLDHVDAKYGAELVAGIEKCLKLCPKLRSLMIATAPGIVWDAATPKVRNDCAARLLETIQGDDPNIHVGEALALIGIHNVDDGDYQFTTVHVVEYETIWGIRVRVGGCEVTRVEFGEEYVERIREAL